MMKKFRQLLLIVSGCALILLAQARPGASSMPGAPELAINVWYGREQHFTV